MRLTPRATRLLRLASIAVVAVLFVLFVRNLDWNALGRALRHAAIGPLVVSSALYFIGLFGKALSWRIMLAPRVVPMARLYRYTIAAFAASVLTPARAGEIVRVWALKKHEGVPVHDATAVALAEKLFDAMTLLMVCAPAPWLLPDLPAWVTDAMIVVGSIEFGALFGLMFAVGRIEIREASSWFARMIAGMHVVRDPKRLALVLVTLTLTWIADLIAVMLVLDAVGVVVTPGAAMLILFTFNLVIALPSTPGQIGTLQVGVLAATSILKIPEAPALAFGLLYQGMQIAPLLLVAFILQVDFMRGRASAMNGEQADAS